ncbi:hypothetical protein QBC47DRAFT_62968 [Echria macrotheca]|uniref:Protein TED1 n=1 Tax=Echria macrotheca TaxID=438768 RepID=A0AAJ0B6V8_9PEZI|nr:hypothetical protein QBC47DRAFT_62968 [Echria macrotheca]
MVRFPPTAILRNGLRALLPVSVILTVYLYLYPVFSTCAFPLPSTVAPNYGLVDSRHAAFIETAKLHWQSLMPDANDTSDPAWTTPPLAPFRLLALGDPQLEGDTSIPINYLGVFPHVKSLFRHLTFQSSGSLRQRIRDSLHDVVDILFEDTYNIFESFRKRVDLLGNDFYLAHIYRTAHWWTKPTHVSVLGDLVGSQWLDDNEFSRRADRFWNRVFRGGERVPDDLAMYPANDYDLSGYLGEAPSNESDVWTRRIINVAGNHDIGYAGDINENRTARFERAFGKINYELRFELPLSNTTSFEESLYDQVKNPTSDRLVPELRVVVVNSMNLDTPAASQQLQDETYQFVNDVINTASAVEFKGHFTVVLTHVPLYKPAGVCIDAPLFEFHDHDGSLREQNQLSGMASRGFLEGILGMSGNPDAPGQGLGRPGIILNGHDHEGCDTWHFVNQTNGTSPEERGWEVRRWRQARKERIVGRPQVPGVREITVRSMMGDFGGNAGLLSVWFDESDWTWKADYATCPLGRQHLWWAVHILDFLVILGIALSLGVTVLSALGLDVDAAVIAAGSRVAGTVRGTTPVPVSLKSGESVPNGTGNGTKEMPEKQS